MTSPDTLVADLAGVSHDSELAPLCRMLAVGQGTFSLSIAVCNSPALRTRLIDAVREQFPAFEVVTIPPQTIDVYGFVRDHVTSRDTALFLVGLEASISDAKSDDTTLRSLNASRDLWPTAFACPVVFWLPEYAARALSETARDFWRIRSHRFYFADYDHTPTFRQPDTYEGRYLAAMSLSEDEKRTRIAELQQRLAQGDSSLPNMQSHILSWWDELATLHQFVGNLDEALRIRREKQLTVCEQLGDVQSRVVTMGQIADILEMRGELDEALRIRREVVLPFYDRLGDKREQAIAKGKIAENLELHGELDEALRIRREEELPVYEQLGDMREHAMSMGKIADILQLRGELDEVLRIRREVELPVYERLGDVRSQAITTGKIAETLASDGSLNEAIHLLRDEVLPAVERLGDIRSRAAVMGQIADILKMRGELNEALRIRCEEQLPVHERLGDVRSRAVTMGKIADILQSRGELGAALRIVREEVLPVFEWLGDVRSRVVSQLNLATLFLERNQGADRRRAKEHLSEALPTAERLKLPEAKQIRQLMRREGFLK